MAAKRIQWQPFKEKIGIASITIKCACLILILTTRSVSAVTIQNDTNHHATAGSALNSISFAARTTGEKTSNAISDAEESGFDTLKKYTANKQQEAATAIEPRFADQLEKPYPYQERSVNVGSQNNSVLDDSAHPSKRSGVPRAMINASLSVDVSESSTSTTTITTTSSPDEQTLTTTWPTSSETFNAEEELSDSSTTPTTVPNDEETTPTSTTTTTTTTTTTSTSDSTTIKVSTVSSTELEAPTPTTSWESSTQIASTETQPPPSVATSTTDMSVETSSIGTVTPTETSATTIASTDLPDEQTTTEAGEEMQESTVSTLETATEGLTVGTKSTSTTTIGSTMKTEPIVNSDLSTTTTPVPIVETSSFPAPSRTMMVPMITTPVPTVVRVKTTPISNEVYTSVSTSPESTTESEISTVRPADDVTLLVRIIFEGSWRDICSKLPVLRRSLTDLINSNTKKSISSGQIIFHQTECSGNFTPTQLTPEATLTSLLIYVIDEHGKFDEALTKNLPTLYEMQPFKFPLTIHSFELVQESNSGNTIAIIVVSCVAVICLILLAVILFIMRKRQGRFNYGERCRPVSLDAYSLDSVSAYNSVRRNKAALRSSKRSYGNPTFEDSTAVPSHPLNLAGLSAFCNDASAIAEEFANIPQVSAKIDELPAGAELKNRYANVIPLPETRVPLQPYDNDPLTEYINASYVRGPKNVSKYYIACQAPTEGTVNDFWRMIWEQQCKVIVMLTDLVENGVEKCTEYIPPLEVSDCHRLYGDYQVTLKKREAREKYAISTLHLKNLENNTFREVSHIWYLWPANGVPNDASGLTAILLESRALQRASTGPILVHCSPGTGRTGTLIALDLCIRQYEVTRTVDVPRVVYTIRRDRAGAVQTRDQYAFIYKSLNFYASKLAGGTIETT